MFQQLKILIKLLKEIALPYETDKQKPYLRSTLHTFSKGKKETGILTIKWKTNIRKSLLK